MLLAVLAGAIFSTFSWSEKGQVDLKALYAEIGQQALEIDS